jgi:hypothetical protein
MALRSSSGVVMGLLSKFSTSTFNTFEMMKAGRLGPKRMPLTTACTNRRQVHPISAHVCPARGRLHLPAAHKTLQIFMKAVRHADGTACDRKVPSTSPEHKEKSI